MSGPIVSMASGIVPELGPIETVEAAHAGGFDAVGLWIEPATWTDATTRAVLARAQGLGLPILDVEVIWLKPGPLDPDHLRILDIGAALGAANALVVSSDPDRRVPPESSPHSAAMPPAVRCAWRSNSAFSPR